MDRQKCAHTQVGGGGGGIKLLPPGQVHTLYSSLSIPPKLFYSTTRQINTAHHSSMMGVAMVTCAQSDK